MLTVMITMLSLSSIIPQPTNLSRYPYSDTFGYYCLDSDTTAPNAPIFNWISIYNYGTRITGLADDNVRGPIPLGFFFKYYWTRQESFYINSNGCVCFNDEFLSAYPFQELPSTQRPNNLLAPLMADLDFSVGTPSCWYWTNFADTCIIEFDSVQFWSTGGLLSYQIILCRSDSSITFQYLTVQGNPAGGWSSAHSNSVGIENSLGNIGIQYVKDSLPVQNMLHDSLAIKFLRAPVIQPYLEDMRVDYAMNKQSSAIFLHPDNPLNIWAAIENSGNVWMGYYPVVTKITDAQDSLVFADTEYACAYAPGMIDSVVFTDTWLPMRTGRYCLNVLTSYTGDICPSNDSMQVVINVIDSFNWYYLAYDSEPNVLHDWDRPAGFANQFVPPHYPWYIRGTHLYASAPAPTNVTVKVFDDDGPGNSPGNVLAQTDMIVSNPNWYFVAFPDPGVTINDGAFFIGATSPVANLSFGMDTIPPFSHRLWEYTGTWQLSRFNLNRDVCIRSLTFVDIEEFTHKNIMGSEISINPNPFRDYTMIRFTNPLRANKKIRIYNALGFLVRSFISHDEIVIWNGKNYNGVKLANGCYFLCLDDNLKSSLHKIILTR
jgi:hypothetical protein